MNQRDDLGTQHAGRLARGRAATATTGGSPTATGRAAPRAPACPQPVAVLDKHAAAAGVAIVTGQLGANVGTAALVAEWSKGEVLARRRSTKSGRGYRGKATPLLDRRHEPGRRDPDEARHAARRRLDHRERSTRSARADASYAPVQQPMIATAMLIADIGAGHRGRRTFAGIAVHVDEQHLVVLAHDDVVVLQDPRALPEAVELSGSGRTSS